MDHGTDILELANGLKAQGEAFVLATVVRTVAATAATAGAKAVIRADGSISAGWIGGGCAHGAVLSAARQALADGQARLVSVQPMDVLQNQGLRPGDARDGSSLPATCARATAPWTCSSSRCCRGRLR